MRRAVILGVALSALLVGCSSAAEVPAPTPSAVWSTRPTTSATPTPNPSAAPSARPSPPPMRFDARRVQRDIAHLAVDIGPREATSRSYARAADWVEGRLAALGYEVRRTTVKVPAGNSWGTPVRRGR